MRQIDDFSDRRNRAWCVHCGGWLGTTPTTRDHVPSRVLLVRPYPPNIPVVDVCGTCNASFSLDEEYLVAFMGAVLSGSTDPDAQVLPAATRALRHNRRLRERIQAAQRRGPDGSGAASWLPEDERVRRVLRKNARGHALFELGLPMIEEPTHMAFVPLQVLPEDARTSFESATSLLPTRSGSVKPPRIPGESAVSNPRSPLF